MEQIGKNQELIELLQQDLSLTSGTVVSIQIKAGDKLPTIIIELKLIQLNGRRLLLRFYDVLMYSFYNDSNYSFYNIEIHKFFKFENNYYLSLDPENEDEEISSLDQDTILAKSIEGFIIEDY